MFNIIMIETSAPKPVRIKVKSCFTEIPNHYSHYTCAIAFSLSHQLGRSPLEIARMLVEPVRELVGDCFRVVVEGDGWLNFDLCDWFIAESLSSLSQVLETRRDSISIINFPGYTHVQYAYARCCALLRLSQQQQIVSDFQAFSWQLLDPRGGLYLYTAMEQRLVFGLLVIGDEIAQNSDHPEDLDSLLEPKLSRKLSKILAANFLGFYDSCHILSAERRVAIARIGLVIMVKRAIAYLVASQIFLPESL
jgi:arginyl-tRNA synthetase